MYDFKFESLHFAKNKGKQTTSSDYLISFALREHGKGLSTNPNRFQVSLFNDMSMKITF